MPVRSDSQAAASPAPSPALALLGRSRWWLLGMLFLASTINYLDRSTLAQVAPRLTKELHLSNLQYGHATSAFFFAYAIMYVVSGRIMDGIGARVGMALTATWWSLAAALHSTVRSVRSLTGAQILLGIGEPGMFPAAVKTVQELFVDSERALAIGIFNSGTSLGAALAPPLVIWLVLHASWRFSFLLVGVLGLVWSAAWWVFTARLRSVAPTILRPSAPAETGRKKLAWFEVFGHRQVWGILMARCFADPAWFFYLTWLPLYLYQVRHFSLVAIGAWGALVPAITGDVGNIFGGWCSGFLNRLGLPVLKARKYTMLITVASMPFVFFGTRSASNLVVVAAISLATFMHQSWSANSTTLPTDSCPPQLVGSIAGLAGAFGSFAASGFTLFVGWAALHHHYPLVFLAATSIYLIGWLLMNGLLREPWVEPVAA